jgi:hypothetical protein
MRSRTQQVVQTELDHSRSRRIWLVRSAATAMTPLGGDVLQPVL